MEHLFILIGSLNVGVFLLRSIVFFRLYQRRTVGCKKYNIRRYYLQMTANVLLILLSSGYCAYLVVAGEGVSQNIMTLCYWVPFGILLLSFGEMKFRQYWRAVYCKSYQFRNDSFRFIPEDFAEGSVKKYLHGDVIVSRGLIVRGVIRNSPEVKKQLQVMKKLEVYFDKGRFYARYDKPQKVKLLNSNK